LASIDVSYALGYTDIPNFCPSENPAKSPTKNDRTKKIRQVFVEIL
jgi:hypothetical protein